MCTEEELRNHNGDVDSNEEVLALITQVGGSTSADSCLTDSGSAGNVPHWKNEVCHVSDPNRDFSTFNCDAVPYPLNQGKRRLCYCHPNDDSGTFKVNIRKIVIV